MSSSRRSRYWDSLPRFLWAEAIDGDVPGQLDERVFLTHTRFPRFVCEIYETDEVPEIGSIAGNLVGVWTDRDGERIWACNAGFFAARFAYIETRPTEDQLADVLHDAAMDYQLWLEANGIDLIGDDHDQA